MSSKTTNYNLHKIDLNDSPPDITVLNQNFDILDEKMKDLEDGAVPIEGGTITGGNLYSGNGYSRWHTQQGQTILHSFNTPHSETNSIGLRVYGSRYNNAKTSLELIVNVNGEVKTYTLFGTHNKDIVAESILPLIGVAPATLEE